MAPARAEATLACSIERSVQGSTLSLEGRAERASGTFRYHLLIVKDGPTGTSRIVQSGTLALARKAETAGTASISVEPGTKFAARLTVVSEVDTTRCEAEATSDDRI